MTADDLYSIAGPISMYIKGGKVNTGELDEMISHDPDSYVIKRVIGNHIATDFGEFVVAGSISPWWWSGTGLPASRPRRRGWWPGVASVVLVPADNAAVTSMESVRGDEKVYYSVAPAGLGTIYIVLVSLPDEREDGCLQGVWDNGAWQERVEELVGDIRSSLLPIPHLVEDAVETKEDTI